MSQFTFGNIDEANTDGFDLAGFLENFEAAVNSGHAGSIAPSYKIQGITWRDTSADPNVIKMWDGSAWVAVGELSLTNHQFRPYFNGSVLKALGTLDIGDGLETHSGALRIKLDGTSLSRSGGGLKLPDTGVTPGEYTAANITVDALGRITAAANGVITDEFTAGTNVQYDNQTSYLGTNSYSNAHGVITPRGGIIRVETTHILGGSTGGFRNCNIRILVNGSEVVAWSTPSSTGTRVYENDITVAAGDQIRIQHKINLSVNDYITTTMARLRIKTAEAPLAFSTI